MSPRPRSATLGPAELGVWLDASHGVLPERLHALGPRPDGWRELTDALALGGATWPRAAAASLRALHAAAFDNRQRPHEALELWREAILGAAAARELAQAAGGSPGTAGIAMLLRCAAGAVALGAVTAVEVQRAERLDLANLRSVQRVVARSACDALLRQWRAAPAVAAALRDAPAALERRTAVLEARAVHFADVMVASLRAGFDSPGLDAELVAALQLRAGQLAAVRRGVAAHAAAADQLLCDLPAFGLDQAAG